MSDLEIVSTFAMQDSPQPVQPQNPAVAPAVNAPVTTTATTATSENMEVDEEKDTIDKALSGDAKGGEEGYESSDLDLSSDEESSDSSSEEEDDKDVKDTEKDVIDDEEEVFTDVVVKTANEIVDIVVEKPTFEVTQQTEIIMAGSIFQIIGNVVVIHCRPGSEYNTLDQGSLLVYENREILGEVFETFGPVSRPYYSVRFNDAKEINAELGKVGASVYYVPSYNKTQIVETEVLRKMKGTDASNIYDEEVGEDEMEFSDDEKEMEFKKKKKRNRGKKTEITGGNRNDNMNRSFKNRHRPRPARDEPLDFDQALEAYQGSQLPPRQQQSYADITDYVTPPPAPQIQQSPQQSNTSSYQTPAELVSALFKSYNGKLPTQLPAQQSSQQSGETNDGSKNSLQSIFSKPPPPID